MTVLSSLVRAYDSLLQSGAVAGFGYSAEKIGLVIYLRPDGDPAVAAVEYQGLASSIDRLTTMIVPQPVKRTSGIAANFLWDKTSYVLGVSADDGPRTLLEHQSFVDSHRTWLAEARDEGLLSLSRFLHRWRPEMYEELAWPAQLRDANAVFAFISEAGEYSFLHEREAARALWQRLLVSGDKSTGVCLATGMKQPVSRLHPIIKGVMGAQTSGASLVSFNLDAFTSHGNQQGENAPVSEHAAFAYSAALNHFLSKRSGHRIQVGDTTVVFWSTPSTKVNELSPEKLFAQLIGREEQEQAIDFGTVRSNALAHAAVDCADSRPINFFVLGLAANAARVAVRFYLEENFATLISRYLHHLQRMELDPPAMNLMPSIWRIMIETSALRRSESISARTASELLVSVLRDEPYPGTLISSVLRRMRESQDVNAMRVSVLKAAMSRNWDVSYPPSLDPTRSEISYLLGRLFACFERLENVATRSNGFIARKYGLAAVQPRAGFHVISRFANVHLFPKEHETVSPSHVWLVGLINKILGSVSLRARPLPSYLCVQHQAEFCIGYYHQRSSLGR